MARLKRRTDLRTAATSAACSQPRAAFGQQAGISGLQQFFRLGTQLAQPEFFGFVVLAIKVGPVPLAAFALANRRISYGEGVERVFPLNSPNIDQIEVEKQSVPMRAPLLFARS